MKLFIYPSSFENGLNIANKMDLFGITISNAEIASEQVYLAHHHRRRITVWNVQSEKENLEAISKNADYIQSDKLIPLLKSLGKYKKQGLKNLRW
ncbi:hypothetical protein CNR22_03450 [Sphingobacteriaceae bacterium]|nr:hypothetical protein CNR22_03450 [Sphingobacteriaceae bacterium]